MTKIIDAADIFVRGGIAETKSETTMEPGIYMDVETGATITIYAGEPLTAGAAMRSLPPSYRLVRRFERPEAPEEDLLLPLPPQKQGRAA